MEDTCKFEKCFFYTLHGGNEKCPEYIELAWAPSNPTSEQGVVPHITHDCAKIRIVWQLQEILRNVIELRGDSNQARNKNNIVLDLFKTAVVQGMQRQQLKE